MHMNSSHGVISSDSLDGLSDAEIQTNPCQKRIGLSGKERQTILSSDISTQTEYRSNLILLCRRLQSVDVNPDDGGRDSLRNVGL
jgi:hypothetical protein